MDEESRIRDNPSIKKLLDDAQNLAQFKRAMPILGPLMRLLGADVDKINETLAKTSELSGKAEELARVPDEFNDLFAERGWILYDRFSFPVAKAAIAKAKEGDLEGAEADLVDHFSPETVRWGLKSMHAVEAFRPRMTLAHKALIDYQEGRYHACVPVVLALLDGMVNEVHQKARGVRRGISAEGVDLSAWDSLGAHQKGLNRLLKIVQAGRRRTTTEQIELPFRNGIMHGVDLGYDNVTVAAKTWLLLFATREWAIKAEQGELDAPPAAPQPTVKDTWNQLKDDLRRSSELKAFNVRLREWKPRVVVVGRDVPRTGPPEAFSSSTPERALAEYFTFWQQRNYGHMARQATVFGLAGAKNGPAKVRDEFRSKRLIAFAFMSFSNEAPAITEIVAELVMEIDGDVVREEKRFRMLLAGSDGMPAVNEAGAWAVVTWAV
jgi:hypothetical protein